MYRKETEKQNIGLRKWRKTTGTAVQIDGTIKKLEGIPNARAIAYVRVFNLDRPTLTMSIASCIL
jgi:hypothetical protein